jgi:hypothetical protein
MDSPNTSDHSSGLLAGIPLLRALGQTPSQVVVREPGQRFLGAPQPIAKYATAHWEFAWLSMAAYGKTRAGQRQARKEIRQTAVHSVDTGGKRRHVSPRDADSILAEAGWKRWDGFPDDGVQKQIEASHLRVEVWERAGMKRQDGSARAAVAVAFGGTVFWNGMDWRANLRWFLPGGDDQYTQVVRTFGPAFMAEFERRSKIDGGQHLLDAELFA